MKRRNYIVIPNMNSVYRPPRVSFARIFHESSFSLIRHYLLRIPLSSPLARRSFSPPFEDWAGIGKTEKLMACDEHAFLFSFRTAVPVDSTTGHAGPLFRRCQPPAATFPKEDFHGALPQRIPKARLSLGRRRSRLFPLRSRKRSTNLPMSKSPPISAATAAGAAAPSARLATAS